MTRSISFGAMIEVDFRAARERRAEAARTRPASIDDAPQIIATSLFCALCNREHWRPDLYSRCVRCELKARRLRISGHGVPAAQPSLETAGAGRSSSAGAS